VSGPPAERSRRRFLRYLAASPVVAALAGEKGLAQSAANEVSASPARLLEALGEKPIASAKDAVNVFDFDVVARRTLPPAHYGYIATGVDDDRTVRANREGFDRIQIRARHLVDVRKVDTRTELFGRVYETPLFLCPAASQRAFHPDGELATARAARAERHLQVLSTDATVSVEDVTSARGEPVFFQLYPSEAWRVTERLVKRAESAGCPVLVLTVDLPIASNRETSRRFARLDTRPCATCHEDTFAAYVRRKPMFGGIDLASVESEIAPGMDWDFVKRLKDTTSMKLVLKGIVTREDAALAVAHGADAVIVSNHGGRAEESSRAAIDSLPEVVEGVAGKVPVLMDSGVRRGTDVFKAMALGARAVGIGRPYLWGLAAFGQEGVETVLRLLRAELVTAMTTCGTPTLAQIGRSSVKGGE
jgi:isopentenyl diphosphate isomerase/L-lactate dehydrogenase-like FMN-dependent dehydrogenase